MDRATRPAIAWGLPVAAGLAVGGLATTVDYPVASLFRTLALAQASLLAIVVSVSLLSVQVSTNQFAPLLTRLYRDRTFEGILAKFGVSILADLALLGLPSNPGTAIRGATVGLAVGLAAWSFVSLLAMERRLLAFLNPEPVLSELAEEIGYDRFREFAHSHRETGHLARNPMLEIVQIAETSVEQRDNYSALQAVRALEEGTRTVLAEAESVDESLHKLFDYWDQLARTAVEGGADDLLHAILDAQRDLALAAVEATGDPVLAADRESESVGLAAADALASFCRRAARAGRLEPNYVAAQGELLVAAVENDRTELTRELLGDLQDLWETLDDGHERTREATLTALAEGWATAVRAGSADGEFEHALLTCLGTRPDRMPTAVPAVGVVAASVGDERVAHRVATLLVAAHLCSENYREPATDLAAIATAGGDRQVRQAIEDARSGVSDPTPALDRLAAEVTDRIGPVE